MYILVNDTVPGFVKIGMTTREAEERAQELSGTGIPGQWRVHFKAFVPDCATVERLVHRDLEGYRHSKSREFFTISVQEAIKAIQRRADENIAHYPGWPDPIAVQDNLDKIELQKRKEAEARRLQREQERIVEEKRRVEEEAKRWEEQRKQIDASTRESLKKWPIGWGTVVGCIFFGAVFRANIPLMWSVVIGIAIWGIWLNRESKKDAIKLRQQWNLTDIDADSKKCKEQPGIKLKLTGCAIRMFAIIAIVFALIIIFFSSPPSSKKSTTQISTHILPPAQTLEGPTEQYHTRRQAETAQRLLEEIDRQEIVRRQVEQAEIDRTLQQEAQRRTDAIKRQQQAKQSAESRHRKAEAAKRRTAENQKNHDAQPQVEIEKNQSSLPFIMPAIPSNMTPRYPQSDPDSGRIRVWRHRDGVWSSDQ